MENMLAQVALIKLEKQYFIALKIALIHIIVALPTSS